MKKLFSLMMLLFISGGLLLAKDVMVEKVITENRILDTAIDLHLTDVRPLPEGIRIDLVHPEAWLFFDNVKPLTVLNTYKNSIYIHGVLFEPEKNGRISIYKQGTVIIPHGENFFPLQTFTEVGYQGTAVNYVPNFYYSNQPASKVKAEMRRPMMQDNVIRSFKLKRGYMATLATEPDGMGYSRCFIADHSDLEVRELPAELIGKVSFIRIFPWEWVSKKGWVGGNSEVNSPEGYLEEQADVTNSTWVYCWGPDADWCRAPENKGTQWRNQEFVPEKWGYGGESDWNALFNSKRTSHFLSYNEPDHSEQSSVSVEQAIQEWPKHLQTGMRVGSPATTEFSWLYNFMDECKKRNYRVDYVAIHAYWGGNGSSVVVSSVSDWYKKLKEIHDKTGRPLWITEWNNGANWTHEGWPSDKSGQQEKQRKFMGEILAMMDTCQFIERYSIYNWVEEKRALFWKNLNLTPAGKVYADFNAGMAFSSGTEVIPSWSVREAPVLSYRYNKEENGFMLLWKDENCEQVDEYLIERSIGDEDYKEIVRTTFPQLAYTDPLVSLEELNRGTVKYRVSSILGGKVKKTSNVIEYGSVENKKEEPFMERCIVPLGTNFYVFSQLYDHAPVMVLGTQTYRMRTPMTTRIYSIAGSSCEFGPSTWLYNNNQSFRSRDTLSYMIYPAPGVYRLGEITAQAGRVPGVKGSSTRINFETSFSEIPAVFVSQVSDNNLFPTTVRVQNVTKEGFDLLLQQEQNVETLMLGEDVCYVAMTPGEGNLGDKKIKVGITSGSVVSGGRQNVSRIEYGSNYPNASFWGTMQTLNDPSTATLRAINISGTSASLFKDQETSGVNSTIAGETVGWCVATTTTTTGMRGIHTDQSDRTLVYNRLLNEIRLLNGGTMECVKVYAANGSLLFSCQGTNVLDVSSFPDGLYIVSTTNPSGSLKFIKNSKGNLLY